MSAAALPVNAGLGAPALEAVAPVRKLPQAPGGYPLACRYQPRDSDEGLSRHTRCARREADGLHVAPRQLARMTFRPRFADAAIEGAGWAWVSRDGRALVTLTVDMGPDPFRRGLARVREGRGVAFYDRRFRRVLATPYAWASPFDNRGLATVCTGCAPDGTELGAIVGGRWGRIDRTGRIRTPVTLTREQLAAKLGGAS